MMGRFEEQALTRFLCGPMPEETLQGTVNLIHKYETLRNGVNRRTGGIETDADDEERRNLAGGLRRELGERQRRALYESRLLEVRGRLQRESGLVHVLAGQLLDRSRLLGALLPASRDFR